MVWYRDKRIKLEYGMSIMDKRIELGLVAWTRVLSLRTTIQTTKSNKTSPPPDERCTYKLNSGQW